VQPINEHRAQTVSVINLKGGVGKTHTAWLLAGVCQERSRRVLVIDTDAQGNITKSLLGRRSPVPGIAALFDPRTEADAKTVIRPTRFYHIDLLPASPLLAAFNVSEQSQRERSDLHLSLAHALPPIQTQYDFIIFDCPPRLSLVSFAVLCASDCVIIPLKAADWGAQGVDQVTAAVEHVRARYNPGLGLLGYLVSRFNGGRGYQGSYLAKLREHFGPLAFDTIIPDSEGFEASLTHSVPVTLHAPASVEAGIARRLFAETQRRMCRLRRTRLARDVSPGVDATSPGGA
jgi:chromosome partitioning protein